MTRLPTATCAILRRAALFAALILLAPLIVSAKDAPDGSQNRGTSDPVSRRCAALRAEIQSLKKQIAEVDAQIPKIEKRLDDLLDRTGALVPPEPKESTKPIGTDVKKVGYRTPIEQREKNVKTPIILVCEDGRVAIFDIEAAERELKQELKKRGHISLTPGQSVTFDLKGGDFLLRLTAFALASIMIKQEAVRQPGCLGETIADLRKPDSKTYQCLNRIQSQAARTVIQFVVYPDSYEVFREVRQIAWEKHFRVNWGPMSHGEKILIGTGEGGVGHQ